MMLPILCSFSQQSKATDFSASLAEFMTGPCHNKYTFQRLNHESDTVAFIIIINHHYYYYYFFFFY